MDDWRPEVAGRGVVCGICPRSCRLEEGGVGACRARRRTGGRIVPTAYGRPCAVQIDPVEKKPLFHFLPGCSVLSIGTAGCNLTCRNCQNADISQASPDETPARRLAPAELAALAKEHGVPAVAYTYTEPLVAFEYVRDCARAVRAAGLANVLVSAGYVNPGPLAELLPLIDAANIDLKTMSEEGYLRNCGVHRNPVLATLRTLAQSDAVLEVTNLVIPGFNDSDGDLRDWCGFVADELGADVPVHFSRFFPRHLMTDRPATPVSTIRRALRTAAESGLHYAYSGNTDEEECTLCPRCGARLVVRRGFDVLAEIIENGRCPGCGGAIYGRF
ncbi:MAG: AmmeMemoRadiSam system radical SAM enzyme [Kiritimatiellae bacterium]|nr:AmmeMemoRadiSam system radical SAM enzyme [Kiritimatiellia bacterium]